jgi:hypothetical protein
MFHVLLPQQKYAVIKCRMSIRQTPTIRLARTVQPTYCKNCSVIFLVNRATSIQKPKFQSVKVVIPIISLFLIFIQVGKTKKWEAEYPHKQRGKKEEKRIKGPE